MSSEIDLYRSNVPHGDGAYEYADWSSAQSVITITAGTTTEIYVNRVRFIAEASFAISAGTIDIAGGDFSHSISGEMELYAISDPFSLKSIQLDGANDFNVGEIKFNPPIKVSSGETFTITPNTLTMANDLHWAIEYWEDVPA